MGNEAFEGGGAGSGTAFVFCGCRECPGMVVRTSHPQDLRVFLEEEFPDPGAVAVFGLNGTWRSGMDCLVIPSQGLETYRSNPLELPVMACLSKTMPQGFFALESALLPDHVWIMEKRKGRIVGGQCLDLNGPSWMTELEGLIACASGAVLHVFCGTKKMPLPDWAKACSSSGRFTCTPVHQGPMPRYKGNFDRMITLSSDFLSASTDQVPPLRGVYRRNGSGMRVRGLLLCVLLAALVFAGTAILPDDWLFTEPLVEEKTKTLLVNTTAAGECTGTALKNRRDSAGQRIKTLTDLLDSNPGIGGLFADLGACMQEKGVKDPTLVVLEAGRGHRRIGVELGELSAFDWGAAFTRIRPAMELESLKSLGNGRVRLDFEEAITASPASSAREEDIGALETRIKHLEARWKKACTRAVEGVQLAGTLARRHGLEIRELRTRQEIPRGMDAPAVFHTVELKGAGQALCGFASDLAQAATDLGIHEFKLQTRARQQCSLVVLFGPGSADQSLDIKLTGSLFHESPQVPVRYMQAKEADESCSPPVDSLSAAGKGRFALRGSGGARDQKSWLVKDLQLDRMFWVPGDADWELEREYPKGIVLVNHKGDREEACF